MRDSDGIVYAKFMKMLQGVDFINILLARFSYQSASRSFSLIGVWLCNFFGAKILAQKVQVKG